MAASTTVQNGGTNHVITNVSAVHAGGIWNNIKQIYAHQSGAWNLVFQNFTGSTSTYSTHGSFTEVIPLGASTAVVECWGASGNGGSGSSGANAGSGGAGGYARSTINVAAFNGSTIAILVGTAGSPGGVPGTHGPDGTVSTVSSGTFIISTLTGNGGGSGFNANGGVPGGGGAGGTASGGTAANTTGASGLTTSSNTAGVTGVNGTGPAGGGGGSVNNILAPVAGLDGLIIIKYSP